MNIAGVVVLYNQDKNILKNIKTYIDNINVLYVIDNSLNKTDIFDNNKKVIYIHNKTNIGIAGALNKGAKRAIKEGYDYLLTMDQDSSFKNISRMIKWLNNTKINNIGLVSPWQELNIGIKKPVDKVNYPLTVMTSGNIINLEAYKKIKGFDKKLFIDCVDFDYCVKLNLNNYKVIRLNFVILNHSLGNIKVDKVLFKNVTHSNHNYIRRYYITRNGFYIGNLYKDKFPILNKSIKKEIYRDIFKIILLEKNKFKKLKYMIKGYRDYKGNKFGKLGD